MASTMSRFIGRVIDQEKHPCPSSPYTAKSSRATASSSGSVPQSASGPKDRVSFSATEVASITRLQDFYTKFAAGGDSEDHSTDPYLPSSDSTDSLADSGFLPKTELPSINPLMRYLSSRDDLLNANIGLLGLRLPMQTRNLPVLESRSVQCSSMPESPPSIHATFVPEITVTDPSGNASPADGAHRKRRRIALRRVLKAAGRLLSARRSLRGKKKDADSTTIQAVQAKGQPASSQRANAGGKSSGGADKASGRKSNGKNRKNDAAKGEEGDSGKDDQDFSNGGQKRSRKSTDVPDVGYPCILSMANLKEHVKCLTDRFPNTSRLAMHLQQKHGYVNTRLYLAEPEDMDPNDQNRRRGVCKVCYDIFDKFDELEQHTEAHKDMARADGKNASADRDQKVPLKFTVMLFLFAYPQSLVEIRAEHAIPLRKMGNETTAEFTTPIPRPFAPGTPRKRPISCPDTGDFPTPPSKLPKPPAGVSASTVASASLALSSRPPLLFPEASSAASTTESVPSLAIDPNSVQTLPTGSRYMYMSPTIQFPFANRAGTAPPTISAPPETPSRAQTVQTVQNPLPMPSGIFPTLPFPNESLGHARTGEFKDLATAETSRGVFIPLPMDYFLELNGNTNLPDDTTMNATKTMPPLDDASGEFWDDSHLGTTGM